MPFDYEALVGHLYVVGGRAISAPPPGTIVEVAPSRAGRGREADTFFALVLPSGEEVAAPAFYEQLSQLSAERYFGGTGSVTAGMRSVLNSINEDLYKHNQGETRKFEANMLCAVLRGTELYLGRVGSGVGMLRHAGEIIPFPSQFEDDDALYGPPMGVQPVPDIKMAHYTIATGTRLLLADPALADSPYEGVTTAMAAEDIAAVLTGLKGVVSGQMTLLAVEFVPPEAQIDLPVREGESSVELLKPAPTPPPAPAPTPGTPAVPEAEPPRRRAPSPAVPVLQSAASKGALGVARFAEAVGALIERFIPSPESGRRTWWSTPMATAAAILIPVAVVLLVVALWLTGTGESEFDLCVKRANETATVARGIASNDVAGTTAAWNAVLLVVEECTAIRPNDASMSALQQEGRTIIDRLLLVDRRQMQVLTSFMNATLTEAVIQGEDIFVLDGANQLVYRVKLTPDGRSIIPGSQTVVPSMRRTASVAEFTVGDLIDIAWATEATGFGQGNQLVALDQNGVLIACPPRFLESLSCEAQQLLETRTWVNPIAIYFWSGRLYVLDPGANQIWRYDANASSFANTPTEYFVGDGRPDISRSVDFAIDNDGLVYLLLADGAVVKFESGQLQPFSLAGFPDGATLTGADAMFLNRNPISLALYVVNRPQRTIYEMTQAGTFLAAYRPQDETLFEALSNVIADSNLGLVYALSGNSILVFDRAN